MTRLRVLGWCAALCLLAFCGFTLLHMNGIVHTTRKNGQGCTCHGFDPSPSVRVEIVGPESIAVGQSAIYRLSIVKDTNIAAGFNVAAFLGSLAVGDSTEQQIIEEELTHLLPKFSSKSDTISWIFWYRAPEVPLFDTLYAAANSVNHDSTLKGDFWNFGDNLVVRVGNPTSVPQTRRTVASLRLHYNYPNPFNPTTTIFFDLPRRSHVRLRVVNVKGQEVAVLVDGTLQPGSHGVVFDGSRMASGVYICFLEGEGLVFGTKMVLVK